MNPKIEEITALLRHCANGTCFTCPVYNPDIDGESGCHDLLTSAADLIADLQQELIDERYRHDRYADFCVAQGEELAEYKRRLRAVIALLNGDENIVVTGLPEEADIQCK